MNAADVRRRAIDPSRIAGVTPVVYCDGPRRGVRAFQMRNARGLELTVIADRALDASELRFGGIPLSWYGPGNAVASRDLDPSVDAFERTFFGGLLTTCGLDAFGPPGSDRWGSWPQHGHVNHLTARDVSARGVSDDGEPVIEVRGVVVQFRMFGPALRLERSWRMSLWDNRIVLSDRVINDGGSAVPHMLLYHCNAGYPLLDEHTVWTIDAAATKPRDADAAAALDVWMDGGMPQADFREQVFVHEPRADGDGWARATATNPDLLGGSSLTIAFRPEQLPALFTWRMLGYGTYVMAAEPANCAEVRGRKAAEAAGVLPMLAPGEERRYELRFEVAGSW
jgi:hypothetical protein